MKKLLSKVGAKIDDMWKNLDIKERMLDLKHWVWRHLSCFGFWKGVVLIVSSVMLHLGTDLTSVLKLGLLSWGVITLWKHNSDHFH